MKHIKRKMIAAFGALFCGVIYVFAFAPLKIWGAIYCAIIGLFYVSEKAQTAREASYYGALFGTGAFGFGVSWVYISIARYGGAPWWGALLGTLLLVAYLASYFALAGWVWKKYTPRFSQTTRYLALFPLVWVINEWLRGWLFTGFPWLYAGYAATNSFMRGFVPLVGALGVSFLTVHFSGLIALLLWGIKSWRGRLIGIIYGLILITFGCWCAQHEWVEVTDQHLTVGLVQGNIAQDEKWNHAKREQIIEHYLSLSAKCIEQQLIIWPEAALPIGGIKNKKLTLWLQKLTEAGGSLMMGAPWYDFATDNFYNAVIMVGNYVGHYYKRHLLPFGEYLPLRRWLSWLEQFIVIPFSDLSVGDDAQPLLNISAIAVQPLICYEVTDAKLVGRNLPRAGIFVTVSDDSWFGRSFAAAQHLEIAQIRSLEAGRMQAFVTNTGITALINQRGEILQQCPLDSAGIIKGELTVYQGATPLIKWRTMLQQLRNRF